MSGIRIAHLINPVKVTEDRDLYWQQPIVFESMEKAWNFSSIRDVDIEQFACFYPEDEEVVPEYFTKLPPLERSTEGKFKTSRKLPYFKDMIDRLYEASDADYFIQTNADIILQPYFYELVKRLIESGQDSFCINKRIIPESFKDGSLPEMWAYQGHDHAGLDCFIFRREIYPKFDMGEVVMGSAWSEATIMTNMIAYSKNFDVYKKTNATLHLGDRRIWLPHAQNEYRIQNTNEFARVLKKLGKKNKEIFKHPAIVNQLGKLKHEVTNYKNEVYSKDCWDLIT